MAGNKLWAEFIARTTGNAPGAEGIEGGIGDIAAESSDTSRQKRSAYDELMTPKPKRVIRVPPDNSKWKGKRGLGAYTDKEDPNKHLVIWETADHVAINDAYPKASIHKLLLFRSPKNVQNPIVAFEDPDFLYKAKVAAERLRQEVAEELRFNYTKISAQDQMQRDAEKGKLVAKEYLGRRWEDEVLVGVHRVPSMDHLHVHVISRDMYSERLKNKHHYNSFTTDYFIPLNDFPLAKDDHRREIDVRYLDKQPMVCYRCGEIFPKFSNLKTHLKEEFPQWQRD